MSILRDLASQHDCSSGLMAGSAIDLLHLAGVADPRGSHAGNVRRSRVAQGDSSSLPLMGSLSGVGRPAEWAVMHFIGHTSFSGFLSSSLAS